MRSITDPARDQMLEKLVLPEVRELIEAGDTETLRELINHWLPVEIALLVADLELPEQVQLLRALELPLRTDTFEYLPLQVQEQLFGALTGQEAADILNTMAADDRTGLLEQLPGGFMAKLLRLLSPEEREVAESLLEYGEDSVGRLMTTDYVSVKAEWTMQQVLDYVREHGRDSETLNHIYVVGDDGVLLDDIRIREVLLAPLSRRVSDIMDRQFPALTVSQDRRDAVEVFRMYDRTALPVVDADGVLVGIVTVDDVIDIAEEEATKDAQKFGGLEALDEPYKDTPTLLLVRKRAAWLIILFVGEMLTATAMGYFEGEIAKAVVLALFVPLIISSGGNSGSQAATLLIRALAVREIGLHDWWWVMRREMLSGLLLGCILGTIGFIRIAAWSAFSNVYGPHWMLVALTVAFSLVGIVMWGTLSGSMLPFVLKRLGFDPATSSAPFVATLVDVTGLIIYFTVALVVLRGTLL
ncbi:MAG: magnesium transporter [Planctomycetaceae bacterium]